MKSLVNLLAIATIALSACTSGAFVTSAYDDIYYRQGDENQQTLMQEPMSPPPPIPLDVVETPVYSQENYPGEPISEEKSRQLTEQYASPDPNQTQWENQPYSEVPEDGNQEYYQDGNGDTYITNNYYDSDDYYDYSYASRIRRFHDPYFGCGYYDSYYTNSYLYSYDPWDWGISIYMGYNFWYPYSFWRPYSGFQIGYSPWGWYGGYGYPYWSISYGYGYGWGGGYSSYAYNQGYNNGWWDGYNYGVGNNPGDNYYNSFDGTNYQQGHRSTRPTDISSSSKGNNRPSRESTTLAQKYEAHLLASNEKIPYQQTQGSFSNAKFSRNNAQSAASGLNSNSRESGNSVFGQKSPEQNLQRNPSSNPSGILQSKPAQDRQTADPARPSNGNSIQKPSTPKGSGSTIPERYQRPTPNANKYPAKTPESYSREKNTRPTAPSGIQKPSTPSEKAISPKNGGGNEKLRYDAGSTPNRYNNSTYPGQYGRPENSGSKNQKPESPRIESPSKPESFSKPQNPSRQSYSKPGHPTPEFRNNSKPARPQESQSYSRGDQSPRVSSPSPSVQTPSSSGSSRGSGSFSPSGSSGGSRSSGGGSPSPSSGRHR